MNNKVKTLFQNIFKTNKHIFDKNNAVACGEEAKTEISSEKEKLGTWRTLTFGVAIPVVIIGSLINLVILAMCGKPEGPPFVPYEYMYRRTRRFPWGDGVKTLFHNPDVNALPSGYEPGHGPTQRYSEAMDEDVQEEPALKESVQEVPALKEDTQKEPALKNETEEEKTFNSDIKNNKC